MAHFAPRDSQRRKVYKHEWDLAAQKDALPSFSTELTQQEIREIVPAAYDLFGLADMTADVRFSARARAVSTFAYGHPTERGEIMIAAKQGVTWAFQAYVALHEAAHGIIYSMGLLPHVQGHGPEFVRVSHLLYEEFLGVPDSVMKSLAAISGVRRARTVPTVHTMREKYGTRWRLSYGRCKLIMAAKSPEHLRQAVGNRRRINVNALEPMEAPF